MNKILKTSLLLTSSLLLIASALAQTEDTTNTTYSSIPSVSPETTAEVLAPVEKEITLYCNHSSWKEINVHLQQGQELIVKINNKENLWHCPTHWYDKKDLYYELNNSSTTWGGYLASMTGLTPGCMKGRDELNTNGNPMIYHFQATKSAGIAYLYFYYKAGNFQGTVSQHYFNNYLKITVE